MRLISFTLNNFRAYREPSKVSFNGLTTIIGRNDIGKSSILEALEIFFNNDIVKIDQGDANVFTGHSVVSLTAEFADLPASLTLDEGAPTTLHAEYLLSRDGTLIIQKQFDCSKKSVTCETFIQAYHPTAKGVENLLDLKEKDLQAIVKDRQLNVSLKGNPGMRHAIWTSEPDLVLKDVRLNVSKPKEDAKRIWEQLEAHLPCPGSALVRQI
jgi:putative ATP-dependent endonuclease of the OLD family